MTMISAAEDEDKTTFPILAPCTRFDSVYEDLKFDTEDYAITDWPDTYHDTVEAVVEEYMHMPQLQCDADTTEDMLLPPPALTELAGRLPSWKDCGETDGCNSGGTANAERLRYADIGRVLTEYLDAYECALYEYKLWNDLGVEYIKEATEEQKKQSSSSSSAGEDSGGWFLNKVDFFTLGEKILERDDLVDHQLAIARPALEKSLQYIANIIRLRPMEAELLCVQRASMDIRNVMALSAEASACLPRTWNAKEVLRDYEESQPDT